MPLITHPESGSAVNLWLAALSVTISPEAPQQSHTTLQSVLMGAITHAPYVPWGSKGKLLLLGHAARRDSCPLDGKLD